MSLLPVTSHESKLVIIESQNVMNQHGFSMSRAAAWSIGVAGRQLGRFGELAVNPDFEDSIQRLTSSWLSLEPYCI